MPAKPKVLIVDDEDVVRETLGMLLGSDELELLYAENGAMGVKMAEEHLPDAILMDVMMPGMDGYEACRQIRSRPALAEIPVIMVTALDSREARLTGLKAGADDFLNKPFDGLEIKIRVRNIMRLNRYRNLMAERSRFLWVVENDDKGYVLLSENGSIVYANQRAQLYLHLPEDYTAINFGRQAERYYTPHVADEGRVRNDEGRVRNDEGRVRNEDGQQYSAGAKASYLVQPETDTARAFWLRLEVMNIPYGANTQQRLVRISDVTDEMSAYQDVRKIHLMVAHKLRTPVSNIYSNMAVLNRQLEDADIHEEEIKAIVQSSWKDTERLVKNVREILKYIDAPVALAEGEPLRLKDLRSVITAAGEMLGLDDITFSMPAALAELKPRISANAMELIVNEILENSRKFHPTHTPRVEAQVERSAENQVLIRFTDDGHSMTAEQLLRARLPYSQSEKWFTGEVSGMGLGLPLIATLVWQAGGQVRVANREDRAGVCITLELPLIK